MDLANEVELTFTHADLPAIEWARECRLTSARDAEEKQQAREKLARVLRDDVAQQAAHDICDAMLAAKLLDKRKLPPGGRGSLHHAPWFKEMVDAISNRLLGQLAEIAELYEKEKEKPSGGGITHDYSYRLKYLNEEARWLYHLKIMIASASGQATLRLSRKEQEQLGPVLSDIGYFTRETARAHGARLEEGEHDG